MTRVDERDDDALTESSRPSFVRGPAGGRRGTLPGVFLLLALPALLQLLGCAASRPPAPAAAVAAPAAPAHRVAPQSSWEEAILYFVIVDRFANGDRANDVAVDPAQKGYFHGGDLAGLRGRLDDLAELGVTALWLTPLVQNIPGFVAGAGFRDYGYHGYWADDFTRLDRRFGSEQELAALVRDAHDRGIKVLLDVVYNHVGYDSSYTRNPATRPWLRSSQPGGCGQDDLTLCLAGLPDLRTELPEVREHLLAAHLGLARRVGLDGFRLDTVKHVEHDFWQEHRRRADSLLGEGFFLLGEVWGGDGRVLDAYFANDELDAGFDFGFQGSAIAFVEGRGRSVAFGRYLEKRQQETRDGYLLAHYLGSHDTPTALFQLGGDLAKFRQLAFLQLTTWGIPTLFYGDEVGRLGGAWPENRSDMPWGELDLPPGKGQQRDEGLRDFYRRLIAIRRAHPALWRGSHATLASGPDWLAFTRRDERQGAAGETLVVVVHRGPEPAMAELGLPAGLAQAPALLDELSGELFPVSEGKTTVAMPARSGRILLRSAGARR
jgi:glycosidase